MKILIADDDFVSRTKLEALLSEYGDCDPAEDGDQVIVMFQKAYLASDGYDLITLDIDMPGSNGHDVLKKMGEWLTHIKEHQDGTEPKILMVTSMKSRTDFIYSFREGCAGYLKKPVTPENLEEALDKIEISKRVCEKP